MANSLSPARFIRQVRQELNQVVWPSRRETLIATLLVLVLVAIMSVFFLLVDFVIGRVISALVG